MLMALTLGVSFPSVRVHVGSYADYVVPEHLLSVRMNRRGWPDMRCKRAAEYMAWVKEQEAAASKKIGEDLSHIINRISPKETPFVTLSRS